jgi:chromosome segregation ATPase
MTQEPLERRIRTVEEAIFALTESQQRLERNFEYMAETQRRMGDNIVTMTEIMSRMDERQAKLEEHQAKIDERQAENDARFNVLLQELRHQNRRIDDLES